MQTPEAAPSAPVQPFVESQPNSTGKNQKKYKFKERKLDVNGKKRNFYNPPGKVMRHLAQQSYYENFYGNQGQFYTMKQKYKTQMCKHWMEDNTCPLKEYCQFAHGPEDLRQPNDPLPKHFGKQALGAVHSNFKTEECRIWKETGECKYGEGCSFFHSEVDKRELTDPLPNMPEGVTLPPMPEKRQFRSAKAQYKGEFEPVNGQSISPVHFSPMQQPAPMIQLSSLADIVALGGFNPNKYLTPQPQPYGAPQPFYGQPSFVPPTNQVGMFNGQFGNNAAPTPFVPKSKAYKNKSPSGKAKKEKTEKKYSPKKTNKPAAEAPAQQ